MAASLKLLFALFLLCMSSQGMCQKQGVSCIQIDQYTVGGPVGFDMEFEVEIKNVCGCPQGNVRVTAAGFFSRNPVDPAVLRGDGGTFLVNSGNPIPANSSVKFRYAWSHYTAFSVASSRSICR